MRGGPQPNRAIGRLRNAGLRLRCNSLYMRSHKICDVFLSIAALLRCSLAFRMTSILRRLAASFTAGVSNTNNAAFGCGNGAPSSAGTGFKAHSDLIALRKLVIMKISE